MTAPDRHGRTAGTARRLLALAAALAASAAAAQAPGLAARVDGAPITNERLERHLEAYIKARGRNVAAIQSPAAYRQLRREALDQLVDLELLGQEAERLGLGAPPEAVDRAVEAARAEVETPGLFEARLAQRGFTAASYRVHVARQLAIERLVAERLAPGLAVADEEVHAAYAADPGRFTRSDGRVAPEAEVREAIRAQLLLARQSARVKARLAELRAAARVERFLPGEPAPAPR